MRYGSQTELLTTERSPTSGESCSVGGDRDRSASVVDQEVIKKWLPRKNPIALVEILAAVVIHENFAEELYGKRVIGMIDSNCALDGIIKGSSKTRDVIQLLKIFWETIAKNNIIWYGDRVPTDANISDGVSRRDLSQAKELGWEIVDVKIPQILYDTKIVKIGQ